MRAYKWLVEISGKNAVESSATTANCCAKSLYFVDVIYVRSDAQSATSEAEVVAGRSDFGCALDFNEEPKT